MLHLLLQKSLLIEMGDTFFSPELFNTPVVLANVYATNYDESFFFIIRFLSSIQSIDSHHLIIGRDFNTCLNQMLDRSSNRQITTSRSVKAINIFLKNYAVADVWRSLNSTIRAYSFFSNVHQTFSHIDYFLLDKKHLPLVRACTYEAIVISDQSPLSLKLKFNDIPITHPRWRFNTNMLSDEDMIKFITTNMDIYIQTNSTPDVSYCTVWEALKAYMRGRLISVSRFAKKQRTQIFNHPTDKISQINNQIANGPSPDPLKERLLLQAEFDSYISRYRKNAA